MNAKTRRLMGTMSTRLESIVSSIEELKTELEYIQEAEQEKYDNLPESLQETEMGNGLYESAETIEELVNRLSDSIDELYDISSDIVSATEN